MVFMKDKNELAEHGVVSKMSFSERAHYAINPIARRLLHLMDEKKSNLSLSLDVTSSSEALDHLERIGSEIAVVKLHIDILDDFTPAFIEKLRILSQKHQFLIFEDRKFADIGAIARAQYQGGLYRIADWADVINAHTIAGSSTLEGLKSVGLQKGRGLLLVAQMSNKGTFFTPEYSAKTVELALAHPDFVIGFITQHRLTQEPAFVHMTPGVDLERVGDVFNQGYVTPERALIERQNDLIIVGRGILEAPDPLAAAKTYRARAFEAYLSRLKA